MAAIVKEDVSFLVDEIEKYHLPEYESVFTMTKDPNPWFVYSLLIDIYIFGLLLNLWVD